MREVGRAPRVTVEEVQAALKKLKKNRMGGEDELVAEMLQAGYQRRGNVSR